MAELRPTPEAGRAWGAGIVAVAATYIYFLIFAQFALLALATQAGEAAALRALMGAMGAGGLVGAAVAAWRHDATRVRSWLLTEFVLCGLAAQLAALASGRAAWFGVFALVGLALGALTVTLAASLRAALGSARLGLGLGLGTGVAYALCNVPFVFTAEPRTQAVIAAAASLAGAIAATRMAAGGEGTAAVSRGGLVRWVVALTALVWMDSAVFYVIQQTPALRAQTWMGDGTLWANAAVHLIAGVAAGLALDSGARRAPVGAAMALLAAASLMLAGVLPAVGPGWLYVAGVSLYSVALVYVPASTGRASVAAVIYGVAGWIGSALGIGMAQDLARVPVSFVVVAAGAVVITLGGKRAATLAVVALGIFGATRGAAADELVLRGREIYIREGCINCHSQYVRPHVALDVERWGPATDFAKLLEQKPPLPGNRRQGPDLANVGNRRSAEWNRLHLRAPRMVSPGSRMPSYAHLFDGRDDSDGQALVAYLASLGVETMAERLTQIAAWRPARVVVPDEARARRLFAKLCVACHGPNGRGDGALAAQLSVRPPDWSREGWRHVPGGADVEEALARIIKFGVPGTPMAGHEYLPDEDVVGLARVVREWRR